MKPFRFRLETLLEFRKTQKEQAQIDFLQSTNQLRIEKDLLVQLESQLIDRITLFHNRQQETLSIEIFKSFRHYFDKISEDVNVQKQRIVKAEEHRQECLRSLAEAEKNYKIVDKFREKKFQHYQIEAMNEEQKLLDEIGLQIYTRDK
ncbi:flagellar export protein FliJ [Pelosinus sp. sgz500959]|uniref:flagellar export protein FliJ n=1 Tax=Pelosinus sp. sgz500959 TaxID=3242472 RepID=UPI00366F35CB